MHPLLPETTISQYHHNNWPTPIIGKIADNRLILIIDTSLEEAKHNTTAANKKTPI